MTRGFWSATRSRLVGDAVLDRKRHGAGERLHDVRQACLEAALDVDGLDHLRTDPIGDRVGDRRVLRHLRDQLGEPVRVERDLVGPDPDRRHEDRDAGENERDPRQDPPGHVASFTCRSSRPARPGSSSLPVPESTVTPGATLAGPGRRFSPSPPRAGRPDRASVTHQALEVVRRPPPRGHAGALSRPCVVDDTKTSSAAARASTRAAAVDRHAAGVTATNSTSPVSMPTRIEMPMAARPRSWQDRSEPRATDCRTPRGIRRPSCPPRARGSG